MLEYDFKNQEIADIVNTMIIYAVSQKASDIHFDPFEEGMKVAKDCKKMLDEAEKKITILLEDGEKDFEAEE